MHCLIVDDSQCFRDAARDILEPAGVTVTSAANSAQALTYYTQLRPDITLIDINLGTENGFELAEQLHQTGLPTPPPLVLISTYPEHDFTDMITASPALGFIPKLEISPDTIGNLLANHATPAPTN